jgi:hypothetical protein
MDTGCSHHTNGCYIQVTVRQVWLYSHFFVLTKLGTHVERVFFRLQSCCHSQCSSSHCRSATIVCGRFSATIACGRFYHRLCAADSACVWWNLICSFSLRERRRSSVVTPVLIMRPPSHSAVCTCAGDILVKQGWAFFPQSCCNILVMSADHYLGFVVCLFVCLFFFFFTF